MAVNFLLNLRQDLENQDNSDKLACILTAEAKYNPQNTCKEVYLTQERWSCTVLLWNITYTNMICTEDSNMIQSVKNIAEKIQLVIL